MTDIMDQHEARREMRDAFAHMHLALVPPWYQYTRSSPTSAAPSLGSATMSKSYGALEGGERSEAAAPSSKAHDDSYDTTDSYYLRGGDSTRTWNFKKCVLVAFPILVAALIIGGAAFFLSRDFNRLYPGHGGSVERTGPAVRTHGEKVFHPDSAGDKKGETASEVDESKVSVIGGKAACSANPVCSKEGLLGDCCPTDEGIQLDCC